jgi:ABC-type transporter Mla maintaining outer membrane lipid asymmetry permease subunit MlaE
VPPVASELLARRPNSLINLAQRTEPAVAMMEVTRRECYRSAVRWEKKSNDSTHVGRKGREIQEMRGSFVGGRLGVHGAKCTLRRFGSARVVVLSVGRTGRGGVWGWFGRRRGWLLGCQDVSYAPW